jgi:hypothetical protein
MSELTVQELRQKFPSPGRSDKKSLESLYCVGGALVAWLGGHTDGPEDYTWFPDSGELARAIMEVRAQSFKEALAHARNIIDANDRGKFTKAWGFLDAALTGGKQ